MEEALEAVISFLLNKRYIGGKHFPENKLIISRTKWLDKEKRREFEKEYKELLNKGYLIKLKKRTGKGSDWHISLNPKMTKEIHELLNK